MKSWVLPAIMTFLLWSLWAYIPKLTVRYISPFSATIIEAFGCFVIGLIFLLFKGGQIDLHPIGILLALLTGIFGTLGAFFYLVAVKNGKISLVVTFTALYPIITILYAYFHLDESISIREGLGIIFALIAIILISK